MRGRDTLAAIACGILLAAGSSPGLARADDGLEVFADLAPVAQTVALLGIVVAIAGFVAERRHRARARQAEQYALELEVRVLEQNPEANTTTVAWSLSMRKPSREISADWNPS